MSGSHGELFGEIGRLVLAANAGEAIDLDAKADELAQRYNELGFSGEVIARAIARSIGAIGFSMARVALGDRSHEEIGTELTGHNGNGGNGDHRHVHDHSGKDREESTELPALRKKSVFPSGVRLAVLS